MSTEFYPMKGVVCGMKHQKIDAFIDEHSEEIGFLVAHFKEKGSSYETVQDLLVDMLDDVIDVWVDSHRKDDCGCQREISVFNTAVDDFEETVEFVNLEETRDYCKRYLGQHFEISEQLGYAISGDGVNKLTVYGTTWQELFPGRF